MGTPDEHLRVSARVKRELERRKRESESYNDVLTRLLGVTDADFDDGFGILSDDAADRIRDELETARQDRIERMRRLEDG